MFTLIYATALFFHGELVGPRNVIPVYGLTQNECYEGALGYANKVQNMGYVLLTEQVNDREEWSATYTATSGGNGYAEVVVTCHNNTPIEVATDVASD